MDEKKIKVYDFIDGYNHAEDGEKYLADTLKINPYVVTPVKAFYADNIIKTSCMTDDGQIKVDSLKKYMLYAMSLLDLYTNIQTDADNWMMEFDALEGCGLFNEIVSKIPEREIQSFETIIRMNYDDMMTNNYEPHAFIQNIVSQLAGALPELIDFLKEIGADEIKVPTATVKRTAKTMSKKKPSQKVVPIKSEE